MDIYCKPGHKVKYIGTDDRQVQWGGCDDPRKVLTEGNVYEVEEVEIHSWYTKVYLVGISQGFNSCSFEDA